MLGSAMGACVATALAELQGAAISLIYDDRAATCDRRGFFGRASAVVFAPGLFFAGLSSSVTAAMAGGSVFAGIFIEPFDINDPHSRMGLGITLMGALAVITMLSDPFKGILWSQVALSLTIITLILLTSSKKVMGGYANRRVWSSRTLDCRSGCYQA